MVIKETKYEIEGVFIEIHCVGKFPNGEGIIILLKNINNEILFSGLIDACIDESILIKNKIKKLDFICWTHPHDDHIEGLENALRKYSKKDTYIIVPSDLSSVKDKMTDKCNSLFGKIEGVNRRNTRKYGIYKEVNFYNKIIEYQLLGLNNKIVDIELTVCSPFSERIVNNRFNKSCNFNEYSVSLLLRVNGCGFLFTADISNEMIMAYKNYREDIKNLVYIKVPHHGSKTSAKLFSIIQDDNNKKIAVSTVYANNGEGLTPNKDVLAMYKQANYNVFCTNKSYFRKNVANENIGVISLKIIIPQRNNFIGNVLTDWDVRCSGDAFEYENDIFEKA